MSRVVARKEAKRLAPSQLDLFVLLDMTGPAPVAVPVPPTAPILLPPPPPEPTPVPPGLAYYLDSNRALASRWSERAEANVAAIRLAAELLAADRAATPEEQALLAQYTGFGASDLAQNCFLRPGQEAHPKWASIAADLQAAVSAADHAALAQGTQYAHFTPETIARAMWAGIERLGFQGGDVLEPGVGIGLFPSLTPAALRDAVRFTGIEIDPTTARIARLLHPGADIRTEDFTASVLPCRYSLAIGNPPFSARVVRNDPAYRGAGLRLHDYFIVKALDAVRPGGLAAFVTSQGTMDKQDSRVRARIARTCELVAAIRLPEGAFRSTAGTDVGVDILFFRKVLPGEVTPVAGWIDTVSAGIVADESVCINRWFRAHPYMVLGEHAVAKGPYGPAYVCKAVAGTVLADELASAVATLPQGIAAVLPPLPREGARVPGAAVASNDNGRLREGSYFVSPENVLMQVLGGEGVPVPVKAGRGTEGIFPKHAGLIRALIPIRDAVRAVLAAQERREPCDAAQARLNTLYDAFVAAHGPINTTDITLREPDADGRRAETHRQPNLIPFLDDPDCWLVASIEDYDIEARTGAKGLIFTGQVIAHRPEPVIRTAGDALALSLHEHGAVALPYIAGLLDCSEADALAALGDTVFRDPETGAYETADAYLSGKVRDKLVLAEAAAQADGAYRRNVEALAAVQPTDLPPSDITVRLGAPWVPVDVVRRFAQDVMGLTARISHNADVASWTVSAWPDHTRKVDPLRWGTLRHPARAVLDDALNARIPTVYDQVRGPDNKITQQINVIETEAAKEKLSSLKDAFERWVWTDPARTDALARLYNDTFNNLVSRRYDGSHLRLPGASSAFTFRPHQLNVIWRMICGGTYVAHAVGAGKTAAMVASVMEQRRLGLIGKAVLTVPGHCLAQFAREFLGIYPGAKILVADEQNFAKERRRRFLARAATGDWDAIIVTHSAFKFIPVPTEYEARMIGGMIAEYEALISGCDSNDRITRKRLEHKKEVFKQRLESMASAKDDFLTMSEIGIDQIYVDEAQEFRKLSFATNMTSLKGVDSDGSQMAWDLFVKASYVRDDRRAAAEGRAYVDRALYLSSGTPITNTLGEMYTLQRFMNAEQLAERGLQEFDAWAGTFGETRTDLELQPSGKYKPVTRFCEFVNVPELIAMFRSFADVVLEDELKRFVARPPLRTGKRQLVTSPPSPAFKTYQKMLDARIKAIEARKGRPQKGDDILLSVITDGRHSAIDLRFVLPDHEDEPGNKLNKLIDDTVETHFKYAERVFLQPDGRPYARPGATQMIFSDLGTPAAEETRGFSAYRWIKQQLIARGIPAEEIAFAQDCKDAKAKARLFADMRAGRVRIALGSTKKMGTGANAQNRLRALRHLDVPWLPSDIAQREGRIDRQGNQNDEIDIVAYATEGSMDAQMWQSNERKARFIAAALSGDRSVRRLEDVGDGAVNQFAMAKAIASGDPRLMQKAGLEAEIARLERLRRAHQDEQHNLRAQERHAERRIAHARKTIPAIEADIAQRGPRGGAISIVVDGTEHFEPKDAGKALVGAMRTIDFEAADMMRGTGGIKERCIATVCGFSLLYTATPFNDRVFTNLILGTPTQSIELRTRSTTQGAVAFQQIEEALWGFESELQQQRNQLEAAEHLLRSCEGAGSAFMLAGELALKTEELAEINAALAQDTDESPLAAGKVA